jgi:single-stranded DNA-binding protein
MLSLNFIQLTGNITKDPQLTHVADSELVEGLIIHSWKSGDNEKRVLIPYKIWGKEAKRFAEFVTTKTNVLLTGRLQSDEWEGDDGQPRAKIYLVANTFQFNSPRQ